MEEEKNKGDWNL